MGVLRRPYRTPHNWHHMSHITALLEPSITMDSEPFSTDWILPDLFLSPTHVTSQEDLATATPDPRPHHPPALGMLVSHSTNQDTHAKASIDANQHTQYLPVTDSGTSVTKVSQAGTPSTLAPSAFQCLQYPCQRRFNTKQDLERHSTTHKTEKSYICQFCNRSFLRSQSLQNHLKGHCGRGSTSTQARWPAASPRSVDPSRALDSLKDSDSRSGVSVADNSRVGRAEDTKDENQGTDIPLPVDSVVVAATHTDHPFSNPPLPDAVWSPDANAMHALTHTLTTSEKRRALLKLIGDDAQVIVDFLQLVSAGAKIRLKA